MPLTSTPTPPRPPARTRPRRPPPQGLLEQVLAAERTHLSRLARARREQARSPEGIFTRLLRAGLPGGLHRLVLADRRRSARPPGGMRAAAAVRPAGPGHPRRPDLRRTLGRIPRRRAWASVAKAALEAIAARRVYPALDADGRDCWRLALADVTDAPDPAVAGFLDAVADWLLRPPGARLVIGDLPYAGRPRLLDPDAADWADRAADAAEAAAAAPPGDPPQPTRQRRPAAARAAARQPRERDSPARRACHRREPSRPRRAAPAAQGVPGLAAPGTCPAGRGARRRRGRAAAGPGGRTARSARDHGRVAGRPGHRQRPGLIRRPGGAGSTSSTSGPVAAVRTRSPPPMSRT